MPNINEMLAWLDNQRRSAGQSLADFVNSGATQQTQNTMQSGQSLADIYSGIANPNAVLNSPSAQFAANALGVIPFRGAPKIPTYSVDDIPASLEAAKQFLPPGPIDLAKLRDILSRMAPSTTTPQ